MNRSVILALGLAALFAASLMIGPRGMAGWADLAALFLAEPPTDAGAIVVRDLRLPRGLAALLAGGALGAAGVVIQTLSRNPLADPGLLGVNSGAAFAIVAAIVIFGPLAPQDRVVPAIAGASAAAALIWLRAGRAPAPMTLILAGVALSALLGAGVRTLILIDQTALDGFRRWTVGSVAQPEPGALWIAALLAALAGGLTALSVRRLDALALGEDTARALGVSMAATKTLALATTALLSAAAVLVAGPLLFVGLIAPHIARRVAGAASTGALAVHAMLCGAGLVLLADMIGRSLFRGLVVEAGLGIVIVGGPMLILLVRRDARDRS
ncbi:MAG: iron ABC transporter permease [Pseudomonadota bacterium]